MRKDMRLHFSVILSLDCFSAPRPEAQSVVRCRNKLSREAVADQHLGVFRALRNLMEDVPAHDSGIETRWSLRCLPAQSIVLFYDSVIIQKRELMQCTRKKTSMTGRRIKQDIELSSD